MENCLSTSKKRWLSIANCENLPEAICRNSFSGVIFELRVDQQAIKIATYWSTRDIPSVHPGMGTKSTNNFPDRTHVEKMFSPFIKYGICLAPRMCIQETWKRLKKPGQPVPKAGEVMSRRAARLDAINQLGEPWRSEPWWYYRQHGNQTWQ